MMCNVTVCIYPLIAGICRRQVLHCVYVNIMLLNRESRSCRLIVGTLGQLCYHKREYFSTVYNFTTVII